jgi:hypothetical protein
VHPDTPVKAGYSGVPETPGDSPAAPSLLFSAGAHRRLRGRPDTPGKLQNWAVLRGKMPGTNCNLLQTKREHV